ncbi:MAG: 16S rRNA (cytidine(1402)-2'-O)-methyltransferase [Deltaproteobacteria bacterium]|nr:16S rRNA (cytidine(1402)-2'-O)-methyltransferase [Deltaproteobacteria bacterium]
MTLFIVSTPIGNPDDITLRALKTLETVDFIICEEFKNGQRFLKQHKILKEIFTLNEHNEKTEATFILSMLLKGKNAALISDNGTPVFADPGNHLVSMCHQAKIKVSPVPGASSLLSAIAVAGVDFNQFYYAGFLSRKSEARRKEIRSFQTMCCPVIIYDTPYRLLQVLKDMQSEIQDRRMITILFSMTKEDEMILKGYLTDLLKKLTKNPLKQEFVIILEPSMKKQRAHMLNKHR